VPPAKPPVRNDVTAVVQRDSAHHADPFGAQHVEDLISYRELRKTYAKVFRWAMLAQIALADGIFIMYAGRGRHWDVGAAVIDVWLAATVIQVVSIVAIITTSLFPTRPRIAGPIRAGPGTLDRP
jgi:hypothetical protein